MDLPEQLLDVNAICDQRDRLQAENAKLKALQASSAMDWAEDHTHLQSLCLHHGVPADKVHGDSYGVPGIMELADMLAAKIKP